MKCPTCGSQTLWAEASIIVNEIEKTARRVQEKCAMVAEKTYEHKSAAFEIRALDIKKLLEGE